MTTFRAPSVGYAVGALFTIAPIAFMIVMLGPMLTGNFVIVVNGVRRTDPSAAIGPLIFFLAVMGLGLAMFSYQHFNRVEVDEDGIRTYNMWNQLTFGSPWGEIRRLSREMGKSSSYSPTWTLLAAGESQGAIAKGFAKYPDLIRCVLTAIPKDARPIINRPSQLPESDSIATAVYRGGTGREKYALFFGCIWCGFGLFFISGWTFQSLDKSGSGLFFLPVIFLMLGAPVPMFIRAFRVVTKGVASVGPIEIDVFDGRERKTVAWSDVIFAEVRTYSAGESGQMREFIAITPTDSVIIDSQSPLFSECVRLAPTLCPQTAILAL